MRVETSCLPILSIILLNTLSYGQEFNITAVKNITLNYPSVKEIIAKFHKKGGNSGELRPFPEGSILDYLLKNPSKDNSTSTLHPAFGAFFNMIVNICDVIINKFKSRRIPRYFKILGDSLRGLGSGSVIRRKVRALSKKLLRLSSLSGTTLKPHVITFLDVITDEKPKMVEFFHAMNALYSSRDDTLMDDYVFFVTKFGKGIDGPMKARTKRFLRDLIFRRLQQQDDDVRDEIVTKLSAVCDDTNI